MACRMPQYTCARCGKPSSHQGHYFRMCKDGNLSPFWHFCCPDDCELDEKPGFTEEPNADATRKGSEPVE